MAGNGSPEMRRWPRYRKSDAMLWRRGRRYPYEMGWLLEASSQGFAFAWRGAHPPAAGTLIEAHLDSTSADEAPTEARVKRATTAHDNLIVVAAETIHARPFPPAAAAHAELKTPAPAQPILEWVGHSRVAA